MPASTDEPRGYIEPIPARVRLPSSMFKAFIRLRATNASTFSRSTFATRNPRALGVSARTILSALLLVNQATEVPPLVRTTRDSHRGQNGPTPKLEELVGHSRRPICSVIIAPAATRKRERLEFVLFTPAKLDMRR
jgi:hypothetical protein